MSRHSENMKRTRQAVKMGLGFEHLETRRAPKGTFIFEMKDGQTGEVLAYFEKDDQTGEVLASFEKDKLCRVGEQPHG